MKDPAFAERSCMANVVLLFCPASAVMLYQPGRLVNIHWLLIDLRIDFKRNCHYFNLKDFPLGVY